MYCTKCGNEMADEALFCPYCGTRRFPAPEPLTSEPSPGEAAAPEPITAVETPEAERLPFSTAQTGTVPAKPRMAWML